MIIIIITIIIIIIIRIIIIIIILITAIIIIILMIIIILLIIIIYKRIIIIISGCDFGACCVVFVIDCNVTQCIEIVERAGCMIYMQNHTAKLSSPFHHRYKI